MPSDENVSLPSPCIFFGRSVYLTLVVFCQHEANGSPANLSLRESEAFLVRFIMPSIKKSSLSFENVFSAADKAISGKEEKRLWWFALLGPVFITSLSLTFLILGGWFIWLTVSGQAGARTLPILGAVLMLMGGSLLWALLTLRPEEEVVHVLVSREDAPALWAMIDALSKRLGTPKIDAVKLTAEYNAAAVQVPAPLPFMSEKAEVHVGLPFLLALSQEELRSVLAHELGHISRQHPRMARSLWRALAQAALAREVFDDSGLFAYLARRFYAWYGPALQRRALPFLRQQEFIADAASAFVVGADMAARALCAFEGRAAAWHAVMRALQRSLEKGQMPDVSPFAQLRDRLQDMERNGRAKAWLARALRLKTDEEDTHPSLSERLSALGVNAQSVALPPLPEKQAAETLLAPNAARLERDLTEMMQAQFEMHLQTVKQEQEEAIRSLKAVQEHLKGREPGAEESCILAHHWLQLGKPERALAVIESLETRMPNGLPPLALGLRGLARLKRDDERGVIDLLDAAARFPMLAGMAAEEVGSWLGIAGVQHDTQELRDELKRLRVQDEKAQAELHERPKAAMLKPPALRPDEKAWIGEVLMRHAEVIKSVHVAQRQVKAMPALRHLEVLVTVRPGFWLKAFNGTEKCAQLAEEIFSLLVFLQQTSVRVLVSPFASDFLTRRRIRKQGARLSLPKAETITNATPRPGLPRNKSESAEIKQVS